jgi:hypothetical protein
MRRLTVLSLPFKLVLPASGFESVHLSIPEPFLKIKFSFNLTSFNFQDSILSTILTDSSTPYSSLITFQSFARSLQKDQFDFRLGNEHLC